MKSEPEKSTEFKNFERLTKRVLSVPKEEIENREKERKVRRRAPKPKSD
jgi:hypothetical protein